MQKARCRMKQAIKDCLRGLKVLFLIVGILGGIGLCVWLSPKWAMICGACLLVLCIATGIGIILRESEERKKKWDRIFEEFTKTWGK